MSGGNLLGLMGFTRPPTDRHPTNSKRSRVSPGEVESALEARVDFQCCPCPLELG